MFGINSRKDRTFSAHYNSGLQPGATRSRYKLTDERSVKKELPDSSYTEP
jgi:hypothetical protein